MICQPLMLPSAHHGQGVVPRCGSAVVPLARTSRRNDGARASLHQAGIADGRHRSPEHPEALRRVRRGARLLVHDPGRGVLRHAGSVRVRQDDDPADDRGPGDADFRADSCSTAEDVTSLRASRRDIAFMFQLFALYPHMKVYDNIAFPLKCHGVSRRERRRRVEETAALLRIEHFLHQRVSALAGGDRQRVALGAPSCASRRRS